MGNNNESVVLPVLDCLCSPKAATPHTNIFSMHKKKQFVAKAVCLKATPVATLHDIAQILKHWAQHVFSFILGVIASLAVASAVVTAMAVLCQHYNWQLPICFLA